MGDDVITAIRRNHALEHATISLLIHRLGIQRKMAGISTATGFYLLGDVSTKVIREAATEALARLQRGENELAISPFCGTNISVAGIAAGVACFLALGGKRQDWRLPLAVVTATLAILLARPLGTAVQKYLTTSADLRGVGIRSVTWRSIASIPVHKVETTRVV